MAVLDVLPGVEVDVCIDGRKVDEYNENDIQELEVGSVAEYKASKTVLRYISSVADKEFTIRCTKREPYQQDCAYLLYLFYVDGLLVHGRYLSPKASEFILGGSETTSGGRTVVRSFKFCEIEISMDDEDAKPTKIKEDLKRMARVGEIVVEVYRHSDGEIGPMIDSKSTLDEKISDKVHEKALKGEAKSHGTSLGKPMPAGPRSTLVGGKKIDGDDYPLAIFKFKYRSQEALKSLCIIDRTPEPEVAAARPDIFNGLTDAQIAELEYFARLLKNKKGVSAAQVKREHEDNGSAVRPSKRARKSGENVIIDLTEDTALD